MKLRESLSVIFQIFWRDASRLIRNPVAVIVILGVIFLPSVYAWATIGADWDPYANTGNLKVGVANEDTGAENQVIGKINIGEQVTKALKENHDLGWQFVDENQAMEGVESGEYYASIVIPRDFSADFLSIFDGKFEKPTINYYVNEKISPVAPKLIDSGADTVEQEIDAEFESTVSQAVVEIAQKIGVDVEASAENAENNLAGSVRETNNSIKNVIRTTESLNASISAAKTTTNEVKATIGTLENSLPGLAAGISDSESSLRELRAALEKLGTGTAGEVGNTVGDLRAAARELGGLAGEIEAPELTNLAKALNEAASNLTNVANELQGAETTFSSEVEPDVINSLDQFSGALGTLKGSIAGLTPILSATKGALEQLTVTLSVAENASNNVRTLLDTISGSLDQAETDLAAITSSKTVEQLSEFLKLKPTEIGDFMASPVTLKTETLYPIKNYGTGVAPFFTNIALWVAGFILVAILHLRVDPKGLPKFSVTEAYFGRLILFVVLGILQAIVVCTGDLIMGVQCVSPALFILAGVVTAIVYVNIMYALVFMMRHVGRAIGVVILIMQIPGASGEYPVQMMPEFFQAIHPFLPFTYSINAMREATGGFYGADYWTDLLALMPFLIVALVLGLVVGRRAFNLNALFDKELSDTDLLVTEETGDLEKQFRPRPIIKALLESKTYRSSLMARFSKFHQKYPILVRAGLMIAVILPILMIMVNVFLPHNPETKLILLLLMVIAVIAVVAYLVVVEYINYNLTHQLDLTEEGKTSAKAARAARATDKAKKSRRKQK